jgi:hypothetical protein
MDDLYIPLNFWFSRSDELAIPLVSLPYCNINIKLTDLGKNARIIQRAYKKYVRKQQYPHLYKHLIKNITNLVGDYLIVL